MKKNKLFLVFFCAVLIFSCKKEKSCKSCTNGNKPPIALAGPDLIIVLPTDSIVLDGSSSTDPDGIIIEWFWKKIEGPASFNIVNTTSARTVVKNLTTGIYKFELTVTDDKGAVSKDIMILNVNPVTITNHPPVANAGQDQTIILPTNTITLDGSASTDPDNNITDYAWTKISGPQTFSISYASAAQTQVTQLVAGDYKFELKVTDLGGLVSKDTVGIQVLPSGTTIIFRDQVLVNMCYQPDVPGACWINSDSPSYGFEIMDTTNTLPNTAAAILGVWVKMDTSTVWQSVPLNCWQFPDPYPQSDYTYCITPGSLSVWTWFFSWINLAGRKVDLKIIY